MEGVRGSKRQPGPEEHARVQSSGTRIFPLDINSDNYPEEGPGGSSVSFSERQSLGPSMRLSLTQRELG